MQICRTDMAREAVGIGKKIPGVTEHVERVRGLTVSRVRIESEKAARMLEKPIGTYITLEVPADGRDHTGDVVDRIALHLSTLIGAKARHVLVIGLGNRFVTPDSLGPRTVEKIFVTRHIRAFAPELAPENMRVVSALAPGVLGVTGLETVEVVRGLIAHAKPDAILCVDALASQRAERITNAIQINDSGLLPGAGVGNRQQGLNSDTLGVPVFAIGVPTVVYASTIANETVRLIAEKTGVKEDEAPLRQMAEELIAQHMGGLIVTPKDVDKLIEDASRRLATGVNLALHGAQYRQIEALVNH